MRQNTGGGKEGEMKRKELQQLENKKQQCRENFDDQKATPLVDKRDKEPLDCLQSLFEFIPQKNLTANLDWLGNPDRIQDGGKQKKKKEATRAENW